MDASARTGQWTWPRLPEAAAWLFALWLPITRVPIGSAPLLALTGLVPYLLLLRRRGELPWPLVWFGVIVAYQLMSAVVFGMEPGNFLDPEFYRRDAKFLVAYAPMVVAVGLALPRPTVIRLLKGFVLATTVLAVLGMAEYAVGLMGMTTNFMVNRGPDGLLYFHGLNTSHNASGSVYAIATVYTYGQVLSGAWAGKKWWFVLAALFAGVVMTLSRSFLLAVVAALFGATVLWGNRRILLGWLVAAILGTATVGQHVIQRFIELRNPTEVHNVVQRVEYWVRAADYIGRSPVLGVGFSRFNDVPVQHFDGVSHLVEWKVGAPTKNDDGHAHNALLMVWAETGLVGVALWCIFLGSVFLLARQWFRGTEAPPELRGFAYGVAMAFCTLLVASLAANNIVAPSGVWPAGFFLGAMMGATRGSETQHRWPATTVEQSTGREKE